MSQEEIFKKHFVPLISSLTEDITKDVEVSREEVYGREISKDTSSLLEDMRNYGFNEGNSSLNEQAKPQSISFNDKAIDMYNTLGDGNCFFHAVFGNYCNESKQYKAENAQEIREEWHEFLSQFQSLNDQIMPNPLKEQLEKIFSFFLEYSEKLSNKSDIIKNLAKEANKKIESAKENAKQLKVKISKELSKDEEEIASDLKQYALQDNPNLDEAEYNRKHNCEFIANEFFANEQLYKFYLEAIKDSDYFVFFEEIPILISLADITVEVYYKGNNGENRYQLFKPNQELLGGYQSKLRNQKKEAAVYHVGLHFSYAKEAEKVVQQKPITDNTQPKQQKVLPNPSKQDTKQMPKSFDQQKESQHSYDRPSGTLEQHSESTFDRQTKREHKQLYSFDYGSSQSQNRDLMSDVRGNNSKEDKPDTETNIASSSDEEYCDAKSYESDSDLEAIPTISHFKQYAWENNQSGRVDQSSFDENKGIRRSFDKDGYIDGKWQNSRLIEVDSCQFIHPYNNKTVYIRKQSPGYLFTFDEEDFTARVCFDNLEELDFAKPFTDIKRSFLKKLTVSKIIRDELLNDRNVAYEQFKQLLQDRSSKSTDNLEYAEDLFQLSLILDKWRNFPNETMLTTSVKNKYISSELKSASKKWLDRERAFNVRKKEFPQADQFNTKNLLEGLQQICKDGINNHRSALYVIAPSVMVDHLCSLDDRLILCISNKDMKLFSDLIDIIKEGPFLDFISNLWDSLFGRVKEIRQNILLSAIEEVSLRNFAPLTHPIYFYLCKSFQELIEEISGKANTSANDLLKNEQGKWSLAKTINWSSTSPLNHSLEQQYRFIFDLMKHFKPGFDFQKREFEHKLQTLSSIPEERRIWLYMVSDAMVSVLDYERPQQGFSEESKNRFLILTSPLLTYYKEFIQEAKDDSYESFRIAAHSIARFLAQIGAYFFEKKFEKIDQDKWNEQIESIKMAVSNKQFNFRDLIGVYSEYWKDRYLTLY